MTTSIRTTWGDIALNDGILNYFYEAFRNAPDEDACYDAVRDYIISYVDEHLPDNLTWFPALSEVYVEIDGDPEGYQDQDDDRSVNDLIGDLVDEAMTKVDEILTDDPDAFGRATPLTEYEELRSAAIADDATQEDINALGAWFESNGSTYWNGEYYDADDGIRLYPIDCGETIGYEIR